MSGKAKLKGFRPLQASDVRGALKSSGNFRKDRRHDGDVLSGDYGRSSEEEDSKSEG
ncbi:hypothetical protein HY640_04460 [Candidatus Woesearchaeota archaeon]|nr:hypothetical protein [Candidatus Woesearchaeota archaeon]